jgi:uncharacterized protein YutE (UPF0331/DUF86 family)
MMVSPDSRREAAVLQAILPQLEAEGFEVFPHPSRKLLPPFLSTYHPDAIALKGDQKVAIEIMQSGGRADGKLEHLRKLFSAHPDWEFRVVYAPARTPEPAIPVASEAAIEDQLRRIEVNFESAGPAASLLIAWAAFEAAARSLAPNDLVHPQSPAKLLEIMASGGYITPDEADALQIMGKLRNEAAHGRMDITLSRNDLEQIIQVTRTLLCLHESTAGPKTPPKAAGNPPP